MNKVLIPTKLSDVAANTLKTAGYEVVQDADTPLEEQAAAHPDTAAGLDHNYVLDSEPGDKIAAILLDPESRHRLIVATDAPGLQVYTGEYLPQARQGIALEAQGFPNAVNTPHFPSVILRPGQSATRSITWTVR